MRKLAMIAAGAIVLGSIAGVIFATSVSLNAAPLSPASILKSDTSIVLVQDKKEDKKETVTQKVKRSVKRAWRNMTGYKFEVSCLMNRTTCTETGKDREDARGKCMAAHPLCMVNDKK